MVNKKNFPNLILVFVSLTAIIFAIGFFWVSFGAPYYKFVAKYGAPPPNHTNFNPWGLVAWGITSGLALTILIWLGAGIERLLARVKKTAVSLGVFLILPGALCICLPASIIFLIDEVSYSNSHGSEQHFAAGILTVITLLPAAFGFTSIYIGAGISALSRWLAGRIWHEPKTETVPAPTEQA